MDPLFIILTVVLSILIMTSISFSLINSFSKKKIKEKYINIVRSVQDVLQVIWIIVLVFRAI